MLIAFFGLCFFFIFSTAASSTEISAGSPSDTCLSVDKLFTSLTSPCVGCTQAYFTNTHEILLSAQENVLYFKKRWEPDFQKAPLNSLSNPHSIIYLKEEKVYYLVDTDNHRLLVLSSLEEGKIIEEIREIAGIELQRPHDIA